VLIFIFIFTDIRLLAKSWEFTVIPSWIWGDGRECSGGRVFSQCRF